MQKHVLKDPKDGYAPGVHGVFNALHIISRDLGCKFDRDNLSLSVRVGIYDIFASMAPDAELCFFVQRLSLDHEIDAWRVCALETEAHTVWLGTVGELTASLNEQIAAPMRERLLKIYERLATDTGASCDHDYMPTVFACLTHGRTTPAT